MLFAGRFQYKLYLYTLSITINPYTMKPFTILLISGMVSISVLAISQEQPNTRVDNNGYWKKMAEKGLTTLNPVVNVPHAKYTGSEIRAVSVITDNSPDIPVATGNTSQSENSIFVNPNDIDNVLNSNNSTDTPGFGLTLYGANDLYSFDGGETWEGELEGAGGNNSGDPAALIGYDGRYFVGYIKSSGQAVAFSDDEGETWTTIQVANASGFGGLLDKNHMWVDNHPSSPYQGYLYDAWTAFGGSNDNEIELSYSADYGITWSGTINISSNLNAGSHNQGVNLSTGPNGEAYAAWSIYDSWPADENAIALARSYDGGQTWESFRVLENIRGIRNHETSKNMRVNSFPSMAVDVSGGSNNGNIYIVWPNVGEPGINQGPEIDVFMIRSEDEGDTWSDPIRVNQDATGLGKEHYFPWITSDPLTGTLSVIFYDDRNVNSSECEVFCANSYDGGETWEDFKVSDVSFTPSPIPGLATGYMGDYLGISAHGGNVYPIWTDNRTGTALTYVSPYHTSTMSPPENLVAILDEETGVVDLSWEHSMGPTFDHFNIYRNFILIGTSPFPGYTDTLPDYGLYKYMVTAFYSIEGESGPAILDVQWGNAVINVDPLSLEEALTPGSTSSRILTINNTGELELTYDAEIVLPDTSLSPNRSYCNATGGCTEFISRVHFENIDNSSNCEGYQDFTALLTTVIPGQGYDITVFNAYGIYPEDVCGIWVDWNQNENFNDDETVIVNGSPGIGPYTATIVPPPDAKNGTTRLRVRIQRGGSPSPCGLSSYGEVEDYSVNVIGWLTANPLQGNIPAGESGEITVNFNSAGLDLGTYEAIMNIHNNDPDHPEITIPITLNVQDIAVAVTSDKDTLCFGASTQLHATVTGGSGSYGFSWTSDPVGFTSNEQDPAVSPGVTTAYHLIVTDGTMSIEDDITITVIDLPDVDLGPNISLCEGASTILDAGPGFASYNWSTGSTDQMITANQSAVYWVDVTNDFGCADRDSVEVFINPLPIVDLGADYSFCEGTMTTLDAGSGFSSYLWSTGAAEQSITVAEAGEYWVAVTDQNTCSNADTVNLTIDPLPEQTVIVSGPDTVNYYLEDISQFQAEPAMYANEYRWYVNPSDAGLSISSGILGEVSWVSGYTGNAEVTVRGLNDCGYGEYSESFQVYIYSSLSIDENNNSWAFSISPNPVGSILNFKFLILNDGGSYLLEIYDIFGKQVEQVAIDSRQEQVKLDVSSWNNGVYLAVLKNQERIVAKEKFVVAR